MINCPHCSQPVDEQNNFYCPSCHKPLRSLTGELLTPTTPQPTVPSQPLVNPLTPSSQPNLASNPLPTKAPAPQPTTPPQSRVISQKTSAKPSKESKTVSYVVAVAVFFVLCIMGVGGFFWWQYHHNHPEETAKQFVTALGNQDMATVYNLAILPDTARSKYPDAQSFANHFQQQKQELKNQGPLGQTMLRLLDAVLSAFKNAEVGSPAVHGDTADVPIKLHLSVGGRQSEVSDNLSMRFQGGAWKVDLSQTNGLGKLGGALPGTQMGNGLVGSLLGGAGGL